MKHRCPNCGHQWEEPSANQQAGGKARWKRTTKKQRSAAAKAAALARWKTKKATGPQNTEVRDGGLPPFSGPTG